MPIGNLTEEEKKYLLELAKRTVYEKIVNRVEYAPSENDVPLELKKQGAAFVTLKKHSDLRGCIGHIIAREPLYKCVCEMSIASATQDPRFPPVNSNELKHLSYEVTILGPLEEIKDPMDFEIGRYGLYIKKGPYSGVLLPQVPVEYGWDKLEFLEHLCYKAGLGKNDWKEKGTIIYRFKGEVIEEND
ncbi:MAG: AmmeMemoRadiSam system protein A [Candidatus Hydrogenedentota bacterium]